MVKVKPDMQAVQATSIELDIVFPQVLHPDMQEAQEVFVPVMVPYPVGQAAPALIVLVLGLVQLLKVRILSCR